MCPLVVDLSPPGGLEDGVAEAVPEVEDEDGCDKAEEVGGVGGVSFAEGKEEIRIVSGSMVTMCHNGNETSCNGDASEDAAAAQMAAGMVCRKDKRKALKKWKRKRVRQDMAVARKAEEEARLADPDEQARIRLEEQREGEALAREQAENDSLRQLWLERDEQDRKEAERRLQDDLARQQEEEEARKLAEEDQLEEGWEYVDDGPAQIIWQGNEIIFKKPKKKVLKAVGGQTNEKEQAPSSNPLPPQGTAFAAQRRAEPTSPSESAEKIRNFGTEQDKTHCPFHIKTGVCRFGVSCSRAHVYPDKSCTLLIRNMYTGPGLAWEHEDGLEYTEEEIYDHFEEFYDDVHEEFQKCGELVNFKVCRNASSHLRGNVYVQYRSNEDAMLAYSSMNGRYYASKQITCEFVGITRWRVAICGEYMRAKYRPCSRGTVCNFLHCFRNPRGEYAWADWDLPPPRFWQCMMDQLFSYKGGTKQIREDVHIENGERSHRSRASEHFHRSSRSRARSRSSDREDHHRQSPDLDPVESEAGPRRPRSGSCDKLADRGESHSGSRSRLCKSSTREHSTVDKSSGGWNSVRGTTDPCAVESEDERAFQSDRSRIRRCGEDRPSRRERSSSRSRKQARHLRYEDDVKEERSSSIKRKAVDSGDLDGEERLAEVSRRRSNERPVESDERAAFDRDGSRSRRRGSRSDYSSYRAHKALRTHSSHTEESHDLDDRWQC